MRVLIAENEPYVRGFLRRLLAEFRFDILVAEDGRSAVETAARERPGLILMDLSMPDMNGIEAIRCIRSTPEGKGIPIIVITGYSTAANFHEAAQAGATDFVVKTDLRAATLHARIRRVLAARPNPPTQHLAVPETQLRRLDLMLKREVDLKALPFVAAEIVETTARPDFDTRQLSQLVGRDPALTARILRLSNSAFYAHYGRVLNLSQAIARLGGRSVRDIALAVSMVEEYRGGPTGKGFNRLELWRHSLGCAVVAQEIASIPGKPEEATEVAFLAGLLHDIGQAVFDDQFHDEYSEVVSRSVGDGRPLHEMESTAIGMDHAEVSGKVLSQWGLPKGILDGIVLHHLPWEEIASRPEVDFERVAEVKVADVLVRAYDIGSDGDPTLPEIPDDVLRRLDVTAERAKKILGGLETAVVELTQILLLQGSSQDFSPARRPEAIGAVSILAERPALVDPVAIFLQQSGRSVREGAAVVVLEASSEEWALREAACVRHSGRHAVVVGAGPESLPRPVSGSALLRAIARDSS